MVSYMHVSYVDIFDNYWPSPCQIIDKTFQFYFHTYVLCLLHNFGGTKWKEGKWSKLGGEGEIERERERESEAGTLDVCST